MQGGNRAFCSGKQVINQKSQLAKGKVRSAYLHQYSQIKSKKCKENEDSGIGRYSS